MSANGPSEAVPLMGGLAFTILSAPIKLEPPPKSPILAVVPLHFVSPTRPGQKRRNDHSEPAPPIQHSTRHQRRRQRSIITISSGSDISSSSIPTTKIETKSNDIMDLCSSPEDRKPLSQFTKLNSSPAQFHHVLKGEPDVIDLCSPVSKGRPTETAAQPASRLVQPAPGIVCKGSVFDTWEDAREAIYACEAQLGHCWRIAQGKIDIHGNRKKVTFRCNHYYHAVPVHSTTIDPADHHHGKTIKTECFAHVNVNRIANSSFYHITLTHWDHNHA